MLFRSFEKSGLLTQQGNRLKYIDPETQEETLLYRKEWKDDKLDMIMEKFHITPSKVLDTEEDVLTEEKENNVE